jgi:hypothetical protein
MGLAAADGAGVATCRYLKVVDKYNDKYFISAFVTAGRTVALAM